MAKRRASRSESKRPFGRCWARLANCIQWNDCSWIFTDLPDLNLNYTDKMGMQGGIEFRVPMLDLRLVAFAMAFRSRKRSGSGKRSGFCGRPGPVESGCSASREQALACLLRAWMAGSARDLVAEMTSPRVLRRASSILPQSLGCATRSTRIGATWRSSCSRSCH